MTEKEVIKHIEENTPLRYKEHFRLTARNYWGDRRKYAFMFFYKELDKIFHIRDESISGECYQYPGMEQLLCDMLREAGLEVIDIVVGSQVHGYIHRVVTLK